MYTCPYICMYIKKKPTTARNASSNTMNIKYTTGGGKHARNFLHSFILSVDGQPINVLA